jgi:2-keto-3-deoxy-L-rhamnonate aldolase RhmA
MGSIIKIDFQNRAYVAQKALAAGFQGVLFTDCKTAEEVRDCIYVTMPDSPKYKGRMGYPNNRWIGYNPDSKQLDYADMAARSVRLFMIEKKEAVENIEEICKVPGVDMIQFGGSDYSMSMGKNTSENFDNFKAAERHCIEVALANGVQPRCEIYSPEEYEYYKKLGVKHICLGDQMKVLVSYWNKEGNALRKSL